MTIIAITYCRRGHICYNVEQFDLNLLVRVATSVVVIIIVDTTILK